jgi:hypothetical protein
MLRRCCIWRINDHSEHTLYMVFVHVSCPGRARERDGSLNRTYVCFTRNNDNAY